ncbi:MAG: hypothetical protein KatS3mg104_2649 [Phycisphaerae bacterium]|nr:MAG: hypothetical protein KatS3mg104_2649 [Phycisphaerae bacterium]
MLPTLLGMIPYTKCQLCQRLVPEKLLTLHHLKPKSRGGKPEHRVPLCRPCHKQIHALFDNRTLERELDQIDRLRKDPQLQSFLKWIRKQDPGCDFRTAKSRRLREEQRIILFSTSRTRRR